LCVSRAELLETLKQALGYENALADSVIEFLTWSPSTYKGLWGAPLIPIPNEDRFALAQNVLSTTNFVRLAEIWLTRGGLDDSLSEGARGDFYEILLRKELTDEIAENDIIHDWSHAPNGLSKKSGGIGEQVDLLIQFGQVLLVGEIKCFLFPAESIERFNFLKNVSKAARQVSRKAEALKARCDVVASVLGLPIEKVIGLRVMPLVVLNQGFGSSLEIEGAIVTDAKFLKLYLGAGRYVGAGVFQSHKPDVLSRNVLYTSETEAAARLAGFLKEPPALMDFYERLRWVSFDFPTMSEKTLKVAFTEMGDLTAARRAEYEEMKAK